MDRLNRLRRPAAPALSECPLVCIYALTCKKGWESLLCATWKMPEGRQGLRPRVRGRKWCHAVHCCPALFVWQPSLCRGPPHRLGTNGPRTAHFVSSATLICAPLGLSVPGRGGFLGSLFGGGSWGPRQDENRCVPLEFRLACPFTIYVLNWLYSKGSDSKKKVGFFCILMWRKSNWRFYFSCSWLREAWCIHVSNQNMCKVGFMFRPAGDVGYFKPAFQSGDIFQLI